MQRIYLSQQNRVSPTTINPVNPRNEYEGMSYSETQMEWAKLAYFGSHPNSLRVFVLFNFFPRGPLVPAIYNTCWLMGVLHYIPKNQSYNIECSYESFQKRETEESNQECSSVINNLYGI